MGARRDPVLGPLDVVASATLCITDDPDRARKAVDDLRPFVALYAGGMGARGRNFYNDVVRGYGWENEARQIQDLYLDGKKEAAAEAVPTEMLDAMALIGPRGHVAERLAAFAAAGVTTLNVTPLGGSPTERVAQVATVVELAGEV